jgi:succinate dehydrogenase / fumarate reductase membrane anchor subunit
MTSFRMTSFRTPLGKVLGLGSAKSGVHHWWMERVTALAGVPLALFLIGFVVATAGGGQQAVIAAIRHPVVAVLLILAILTTVRHMQLGMQVILEDYVHGRVLLIASLLANSLFCIAVAVAGVTAVLAICFGA